MMLKIALFALALFIAGYPGFGAQAVHGAGGEGNVVDVRIFNVAFEPGEITVEEGTTVRWVNLDPVDHDVTSGTVVKGRKARQVKEVKFPDGRFHSGTYGKGGSFEVTFKEKGRYPYFCNIHPIMYGEVTVR